MKNGSLKQVAMAWARNYDLSEYKTTPNGSLYREVGVIYSYGSHFPLGVHCNRPLINADRYSNSTSKHQSYTIREVSNPVEIPFSALSAMINNSTYDYRRGYEFKPSDLRQNLYIMDNQIDKWYETSARDRNGNIVMRHELGGCLFKYNDRYIFSGIDETGLGTSRYFMTELIGEPQTVAEALESMKPQEVKDYENAGYEVKRQGEWFFVKCIDSISPKEFEKNYHIKREEGDTGHHFATEGVMIEGVQFVRGIVKHEERDHKQCKLYEDIKNKSWWMAFHNVQKGSFNAVGNVD